MKFRSHPLVPLAALAVVILLAFTTCKRPPCPSCQTPVPVITTTTDSMTIRTDSVGAGLDVQLRVSGHPGNTPLFSGTVPAGAETSVPLEDSIGQVRVRMDYLPAGPGGLKARCVCPVDVIINNPNRLDTIVMDVIIQYTGCDSICAGPLNSALSAGNPKLTITRPFPASNALLCRFEINNHLFNIEYQSTNKLVIESCGSFFSLSPYSNGKTTLSGLNSQFELSFAATTGSAIIIEITRTAGIHQIRYCTP